VEQFTKPPTRNGTRGGGGCDLWPSPPRLRRGHLSPDNGEQLVDPTPTHAYQKAERLKSNQQMIRFFVFFYQERIKIN
jgi:hypothetical protein